MAESIRELVDWAAAALQAVSDSARLDAEILLAHALQRDRSYLFTWPDTIPSPAQLEQFKTLVQRRQQPQPVAYLVGTREFYSLPLHVTSATLVPRPETELLVDEVLSKVGAWAKPRVLDLGTGSGAIALAVKQHAPASVITATDVSAEALAVARRNAEDLGLEIGWMQSDWFSAIAAKRRFDVIVSNPPYIAEQDPYLEQGDLPAEPRLALASGVEGLDAIKKIVAQAAHFLEPGGWLMLEHGFDQRQAVASLLARQGFTAIECRFDFNELARVSIGRLPRTDEGADSP